eukprot:scaffold2104_cov120-Isochrysis_galbana.AAC.3
MRKEQPSGQRRATSRELSCVSDRSVVHVRRGCPLRLSWTDQRTPAPQPPMDSPHSTRYDVEESARTTGADRISLAETPGTSGRLDRPAGPEPNSLLARSRKTTRAHVSGSAPARAISRSRLASGAQPDRSGGRRRRTSAHPVCGRGVGTSGASGAAIADSVLAPAGALQPPRPATLTAATLKVYSVPARSPATTNSELSAGASSSIGSPSVYDTSTTNECTAGAPPRVPGTQLSEQASHAEGTARRRDGGSCNEGAPGGDGGDGGSGGEPGCGGGRGGSGGEGGGGGDDALGGGGGLYGIGGSGAGDGGGGGEGGMLASHRIHRG